MYLSRYILAKNSIQVLSSISKSISYWIMLFYLTITLRLLMMLTPLRGSDIR